MHEDDDQTLLFVDLLGFSALIEAFPTRTIEQNRPSGMETSRTGPGQNRLNAFHHLLDRAVFNEALSGRITAMLFSDCAFINAGNSLATTLLAVDLMRRCVDLCVPVRMGLGRGTFYSLNYSTESSGDVLVSRSRFLGTSVVRAHVAEQAGPKGMRILIHPSVIGDRHLIEQRARLLKLPNQTKSASHEIDYMYETSRNPDRHCTDVMFYERVISMDNPAAPRKVRRHYADTIAAMNRMRVADGRKPISRRSIRAQYIPVPLGG